MNGVFDTRSPECLGAQWIPGAGVSFRTIAGSEATEVDLVRFLLPGSMEHEVIPMSLVGEWQRETANDYQVLVPHARPGDWYGYRVRGPFAPNRGLRFDYSKLLTDPLGRMCAPHFVRHDSLKSRTDEQGWLVFDDSLPYAPRSVVVDPDDFDWEGDEPLALTLHPKDYVFYRAPVRGLTIKRPADLLCAKPGTFAAIASDHMLERYRRLGVTVLELYTVQQSLPGEGGDWGFNSLGYASPDWSFGTTPEDPASVVREFKTMVKRLHRAGILVSLEKVDNHSLEGNELGPTLCLKGLDNRCYRICGSDDEPDSLAHYYNWSGCGNTHNFDYAPVRRMCREGLRRWVLEYHVDLFRIDLAGIWFGHNRGFDPHHEMRQEIDTDPVLSRIPVIALEGWTAHNDKEFRPRMDLHTGRRVPLPPGDGSGYAVWSDRYRDVVREYWLGTSRHLSSFIDCITGSRSMPNHDQDWGRKQFPPEDFGWWSTVNGIWYHDGFNAAQWLMHNRKSNEDGHPENHSWNCGAEGVPNDPELAAQVEAVRWRIWKAAMATLLLSPLPLVRAGDERRYYPGDANNNMYNAGDEANGIDHDCSPDAFEYSCGVLALRREFASLGQMIFASADFTPGEAQPFGCYFSLGGHMSDRWWKSAEGREVTLYLPGNVRGSGAQGSTSNILLMFNSRWEPCEMGIPSECREPGRQWIQRLHTGLADPFARRVVTEEFFVIDERSVALLVSEAI